MSVRTVKHNPNDVKSSVAFNQKAKPLPHIWIYLPQCRSCLVESLKGNTAKGFLKYPWSLKVGKTKRSPSFALHQLQPTSWADSCISSNQFEHFSHSELPMAFQVGMISGPSFHLTNRLCECQKRFWIQISLLRLFIRSICLQQWIRQQKRQWRRSWTHPNNAEYVLGLDRESLCDQRFSSWYGSQRQDDNWPVEDGVWGEDGKGGWDFLRLLFLDIWTWGEYRRY